MATNIVRFPSAAPPKRKTQKRNAMPDGRKRVRLTVEEPDGRKWQKPFYGKTIKEAEQNRDNWVEAQRLAKLPPPPPKPTRETVAERADLWYKTHYIAGDMDRDPIGSKQSIIKKIKESALGNMYIDEVLLTHVKEFAIASRASKSHTAKIRSTLNAIFEVSVGDKLIEQNPCAGIKWEHNGETHHRALEVWERKLVTDHWQTCAAGVGAMIMLYAGERPDEARVQSLQRLTEDDVLVRDSSRFLADWKMRIKIDCVKTEAGIRDIPIYPQLRDVIKYAKTRTDGIMWLSATGNVLTESAYRRNWDTLLHALRCAHFGVKPNKNGKFGGIRIDLESEADQALWESILEFVPYSLRHTFCTMLFEAGVDIETAKYYMGHRDSKITEMVYTHLSQHQKALSRDKSIKHFESLYTG